MVKIIGNATGSGTIVGRREYPQPFIVFLRDLSAGQYANLTTVRLSPHHPTQLNHCDLFKLPTLPLETSLSPSHMHFIFRGTWTAVLHDWDFHNYAPTNPKVLLRFFSYFKDSFPECNVK